MRRAHLIFVVSLFCVLSGTTPRGASVLRVDTAVDDPTLTACDDAVPNDCSLRGAIIASAPDVTIIVPSGIYRLTRTGFEDYDIKPELGDLDITGDRTIIGAGAATTIIDGCADATGGEPCPDHNRQPQVFHVVVPRFRGDIHVSIAGVTIQNGRIGVRVQQQDAPAGAPALELRNCLVSGNLDAGIYGGPDARLNLTLCTVSGNNGGGIVTDRADLTVTDSIISGNAAVTRQGGGIFNGGTARIERTVVSNNTAAFGGGIFSVATLTLIDSTVSGNFSRNGGGGLMLRGGPATVTGSTISGNHAGEPGASFPDGGGILLDGRATTLALVNSTISGNAATGSGGGIAATSDQVDEINLRNATISNNIVDADNDGLGDGGGIFNYVAAVSIANTIIAANVDDSPESEAPDCRGPLTSQGFNLIQRTAGCYIGGDTTGNVSGIAAGLAPLANNGGLTHTHALVPGSPAIDAGSPLPPGTGDSSCESTDQRGITRPIDGDRDRAPGCDIGAFEAAPPVEPLRVSGIVPNRGGNTGSLLTMVQGTGIASGTSVKLVRSNGSEIVAASVTVAGNLAAASFDLTGGSSGAWHVVVTNSDGTSAMLPDGFTIEEGRQPQLWVDIIGRTLIRDRRGERYRILFGNRGNVDALGVQLVLVTIPHEVATSLRFEIAPPPPQRAQVATDWSKVPIDVVPESPEETILPLFLPVVPAGFTGVLEVFLQVPVGSFVIRAGVAPPLFHPDLDGDVVDFLTASARDYALRALGVVVDPELQPQLEEYLARQLQTVVARGIDVWVSSLGTQIQVYSSARLLFDLAQFASTRATSAPGALLAATRTGGRVVPVVAHALANPSPRSPARWTVGRRLAVAPNRSGLRRVGIHERFTPEGATRISFTPERVAKIACQEVLFQLAAWRSERLFRGCSSLAYGELVLVSGTSHDPNDKVGSRGAGQARYLSGEEPLRYSIFFENIETASLPAQQVVVTDQLDATKVDLSTFGLGPIAFGERTVVPPPGVSDFSSDVDLRPVKNLIVRVQAHLDRETGLFTWRFESIDPATGQLTDDPADGFLPPNLVPPQGEGSVLFTVKPRQHLATGTEVQNRARVVFDANGSIDTPEWLNTIDNTKPESHVVTLAARQTSRAFAVEWAGIDEGSGIRDYTIFVSEDGGPFTQLMRHTTDTSIIFPGRSGSRYAFFSVASDQTGNLEDPPPVADAMTQVVDDTSPPTTTASLSPEPNASGWNNTHVTVRLTASDNDGGTGVQELIVSGNGAQTIPPRTVTGASGSIDLAAEGETVVAYQARDHAGNLETPQTIVVKIDRTPPMMSCGATADRLWPPNHQMVTVNVSVGLTDALSGPVGFELIATTSSEPDTGQGAGDFPNDIQNFLIGTQDTSGRLRAERAGAGPGRVYAFVYRGSDLAGNSAACTTTVVVPHDQR